MKNIPVSGPFEVIGMEMDLSWSGNRYALMLQNYLPSNKVEWGLHCKGQFS